MNKERDPMLNRMTDQEIIDVVTAKRDGMFIEETPRDGDGSKWRPAIIFAPWNFAVYVYRVKREPREGWVNEYTTQIGPVYNSLDEAKCARVGDGYIRTIHFREVIE